MKARQSHFEDALKALARDRSANTPEEGPQLGLKPAQACRRLVAWPRPASERHQKPASNHYKQLITAPDQTNRKDCVQSVCKTITGLDYWLEPVSKLSSGQVSACLRK